MKKLIKKIGEYIIDYFTDTDSNKLEISIPKNFKTKKEQNFFIRRTKDFIIENTEVGEWKTLIRIMRMETILRK